VNLPSDDICKIQMNDSKTKLLFSMNKAPRLLNENHILKELNLAE